MMHNNSRLAVEIIEDYGNLHIVDENYISIITDIYLTNSELEYEYFEGEEKKRLSSFYERDQKLRITAIIEHGFCMQGLWVRL